MSKISKIRLSDGMYDVADASAVYAIKVDGHVKEMSDGQEISLETKNAYSTIQFTDDDYVYVFDYNDLDYEYGYKYHKDYYGPDQQLGFCSDVRSGDFFGRNFDFYYNYEICGVCRTPAKNGLHQTLGVLASMPALTVNVVKSGKIDDAYRAFPFFMMDGVNDCHVFCGMNVVHIEDDRGVTRGGQHENPDAEVCAVMLPRYILDHFSSADEAVDALKNRINVYAPSKNLSDFELHYMIGDSDKTYIVEFVNNEAVVSEYPYMTNFYVDRLHDLVDGKITRNTDSSVNINGVNTFGIGVERWNIIVDNYDAASTLDGMRRLMREELAYTRTYPSAPNQPDEPWYSEMVGQYPEQGVDITITSDASLCEAARVVADEGYKNADRRQGKEGIWHTSHSSIYDIRNLKLYLAVQEKESGLKKEYTFDFNKDYNENIDNLMSALLSRIVTAKNGESKTLSEWIDKVAEFENETISNELVVASALNDLNSRLVKKENE